MIENPEYDDINWNPLVCWQLGLTAAQDTVLIVNAQGETGEKATLVFTDAAYVRGVLQSLTEGVETFEVADEQGFEYAAATITDADEPAPDDLSDLVDLLDPEELADITESADLTRRADPTGPIGPVANRRRNGPLADSFWDWPSR